MEMTHEQLALDFVLYCYFGDTSDPKEAAIDRAYVDMASHTLTGFDKDYNAKWHHRFLASTKIKAALEHIGDPSYDEWHDQLCREIMAQYPDALLSYGQAQKWINMTMKYLYVLSQFFSLLHDEARAAQIPAFFSDEDNIRQLHIPLDRYVLKELGVDYTWSKLEEAQEKPRQYSDCRAAAHDKHVDFFTELRDWPKWAKKHAPVINKNSYEYFKKGK